MGNNAIGWWASGAILDRGDSCLIPSYVSEDTISIIIYTDTYLKVTFAEQNEKTDKEKEEETMKRNSRNVNDKYNKMKKYTSPKRMIAFVKNEKEMIYVAPLNLENSTSTSNMEPIHVI